MGRRILIVSTVEHPEEALREHVGDDDAVTVIVPVVRQGVLDWLANDERAFSEAERAAAETAEALPGETVESAAGEADVGLAIRDALASFPADERSSSRCGRASRRGPSSRPRPTARRTTQSTACPCATS